MFALLKIASPRMPIPSRYPAIPRGNQDAKIHIEVFVDLLCPDCLATWPNVIKVLNDYPNDVRVSTHLNSLPYHTWAFALTRALFALDSISDDHTPINNIIDAMYIDGDQNQFTNEALGDKNQSIVLDQIFTYIKEKAQLESIDPLIAAYQDVNINLKTRIAFKYSMEQFASATPTVFVNGVQTELNEDSSYDDWKAVIDYVLNY